MSVSSPAKHSIRVIVLSLVLTGGLPNASYSIAKTSYTITLSIPESGGGIRAGSDVVLKITEKNESSTNIRTGYVLGEERDAELEYDIKVWRDDGSSVPMTDLGRDIYNPASALRKKLDGKTESAIGVTLKPGEAFSETAMLSYIYQMTEPGQYFVQAKQLYPDRPGGRLVTSNVLQFTITP